MNNYQPLYSQFQVAFEDDGDTSEDAFLNLMSPFWATDAYETCEVLSISATRIDEPEINTYLIIIYIVALADNPNRIKKDLWHAVNDESNPSTDYLVLEDDDTPLVLFTITQPY